MLNDAGKRRTFLTCSTRRWGSARLCEATAKGFWPRQTVRTWIRGAKSRPGTRATGGTTRMPLRRIAGMLGTRPACSATLHPRGRQLIRKWKRSGTLSGCAGESRTACRRDVRSTADMWPRTSGATSKAAKGRRMCQGSRTTWRPASSAATSTTPAASALKPQLRHRRRPRRWAGRGRRRGPRRRAWSGARRRTPSSPRCSRASSRNDAAQIVAAARTPAGACEERPGRRPSRSRAGAVGHRLDLCVGAADDPVANPCWGLGRWRTAPRDSLGQGVCRWRPDNT
mmetsp:Transcript_48212/g.95476  ORF Transcript_48212/g.95476 Transcript_48212/m.95476 type:complete len:284 (-) Transcript_48212:108-959(-)